MRWLLFSTNGAARPGQGDFSHYASPCRNIRASERSSDGFSPCLRVLNAGLNLRDGVAILAPATHKPGLQKQFQWPPVRSLKNPRQWVCGSSYKAPLCKDPASKDIGETSHGTNLWGPRPWSGPSHLGVQAWIDRVIEHITSQHFAETSGCFQEPVEGYIQHSAACINTFSKLTLLQSVASIKILETSR